MNKLNQAIAAGKEWERDNPVDDVDAEFAAMLADATEGHTQSIVEILQARDRTADATLARCKPELERFEREVARVKREIADAQNAKRIIHAALAEEGRP